MIPPRLIRCVPEHTTDEVERWWEGWQEFHPHWEALTIRDPIDPTLYPLTGHLFEFCTCGAQLAGLVRLEAVYTLGGVYIDSDIEPLRPIDDLLYHPAFIGTEDGTVLTDALFGAEAGHLGIRACIDRVLTLPMSAGPHATGPGNTTAVLAGREDVTVLARRMLFPYDYREKHRRGEDFRVTSPESYAVHHWAWSWQTPTP